MEEACQKGIDILTKYPRDSQPTCGQVTHYMAMDIKKWNKDLSHLSSGHLVAVHFYERGTCDLFLVSEDEGTFLLETPWYRLRQTKVNDKDKQIDYWSLLNGMGHYHCQRTKRHLYMISKTALAIMGTRMQGLTFKAIEMMETNKKTPYPLTWDDYQQIEINFNKLLEDSW